MSPILRAVLFGGCLLLGGCGGEERENESADTIEPQDKAATGNWLSATDHTDPAVWLASRERGRALAETDPEVADLRRALASARTHFLEPERMLANRTAQVGRMLADDGYPEDYAALLGALSQVAAAAGTRQTYGEICQHYFNLRHRGIARGEALAILSERYRMQRRFR